ncbi:MAG: metallophosphoesterase family protein [Kiritimatiellia bacterium]
MMSSKKYAILGDIHGNLEALETVLKDAGEQDVTDYVSVGDIVGYNANPSECVEKVRELGCVGVCGNHDHYCCRNESLDDFHPLAAHVVDWTRKHLSDEQIEYLRNLKLVQNVGGFSIVHSTLDMPEKWGYVFDSLEADANFNYQRTTLCFHGHTHVPVVYTKQNGVRKDEPGPLKVSLGKKYFINVGSVGQPRDGDPRASYVTYEPGKKMVEWRRLSYDIAAVQEKIKKAGLPERLARRLELGK